MVFRRESKSDAFQRQISALRQQLGGAEQDAGRGNEADDDRAQTQAQAQIQARDSQRADRDRERLPGQPGAPGGDPGGFSFGGYSGAATGGRPAPPPANVEESMPMIVTPVADERTSVIAYGAAWKGDLASDGTLHVHGHVEGSLRAKEDIYVAEEADVDAALTATNVIIAGLVKGTIRCAGRFEVLPAGRVSGDIQAPTLIVHEGANVVGEIRMDGGRGEQPSTTPAEPAVRRVARGGD